MQFFLILAGIIIATLLGGLTAIYFKDKLHIILGFSAGAILAIAFFCLIPEALEISNNYHLTGLFIVTGFIIYMIIERFCHSHNNHTCENLSHSGKFAAIALIFHSLIDGMAIGIALQCNDLIAIIIIIAILSHKFADGLSTVGVVFYNKGKIFDALYFLFCSAFAPIIGVALSFFCVINQHTLSVIFALFGGFFLYLSTSQLLIEAYHCHNSLWTTAATLAGIAVIYIAILLAGNLL
jgi:ZIP family zinc transporter